LNLKEVFIEQNMTSWYLNIRNLIYDVIIVIVIEATIYVK